MYITLAMPAIKKRQIFECKYCHQSSTWAAGQTNMCSCDDKKRCNVNSLIQVYVYMYNCVTLICT